MARYLTFITVLFILAACSPNEVVQPTIDTEEVEQAIAEGIIVTFDGEECIVSGPLVLPEGDYVFIHPPIVPSADFYLARIEEGKTYQDVVELQGGPGKDYPMPLWMTHATKLDTDIDFDTGEKRITYLLEEGVYYFDAWTYTEGTKAWLCEPITIVKE